MIPYSRMLAATLAMAISGLVLANAQAAEIKAVYGSCFTVDECPPDRLEDSIIIRGVIEKGDAQVFRSVARRMKILQTVILRSPGGNVFEAMQIGRDIRRLLLETEGPFLDFSLTGPNTTTNYGGGDRPLCVENGGVGGDYKGSRYRGSQCVCASACFLIYAAGARRNQSYVGIHRGYLNETISREMDLGATSEFYAKISKPMQDYLQEMNVPRRYADIMLRTSSRDIYVPKYPEVMADFYGWVPEIEEWLIAKCDTVNEQKVQQMEGKALADGKLKGFLEFRDNRELCIQIALLAERDKRRQALPPPSKGGGDDWWKSDPVVDWGQNDKVSAAPQQQGSAELPQGFTLDAPPAQPAEAPKAEPELPTPKAEKAWWDELEKSLKEHAKGH